MDLRIETLELLLFIAAIVGIIARRLGMPYTVGLIFAGFALAFAHLPIELRLTRNLLFSALLPPLIFEAAIFLPWSELRKEGIVLLILVLPGVALSAGIIALGIRYSIGWTWDTAILFGVLISATDPVAVIALFKDLKAKGRARFLLEAESLLNDGTAAVLFGIALAMLSGSPLSAGGIVERFIVVVIGSVVCGLFFGGGTLALAGRSEDHLIEITLTTVAAYGSFLIAESLHFSGILATLTAGILAGNVGYLGMISEKGREAVESFWEYVAFASNSLIFLLIGIRLAHQDLGATWVAASVAIPLVIASRAAMIYGCGAIFSKTRWRIERNHLHVLFWGGLRGALALGLALGLPDDPPYRQAIAPLVFAVVAFSVIVQGLTMKTLLKKTGILSEGDSA